ncbi:MAG TPA: methyltransferase [Candidatus Binataceae bacterium]|nr:methyltransferase [Candidatus Binataceae bacterium]
MELAHLLDLAGAHASARALQVALKLGLFEALADGPIEAAELARRLGAVARETELLANALVALGVLNKSAGHFALSPAARRFLLRSSPRYAGGMIEFDEFIFPLFTRLEECVRQGAPARRPDMFQNDPEETRRFILAMDSLVRARGDAEYLAEHLELAGVNTIADIGGGPATYMLALLARYPALRAAILDLPASLQVARQLLTVQPAEVRQRLELVEFDYRRDELPAAVDAIFLSNIVHGEDEAVNRALMARCFRGLAPGGRVIIKDHVMSEDLLEPAAGALFSLYLMLATRGRDYSFKEIEAWVRQAGFGKLEWRRLPAPPFNSSLILAWKDGNRMPVAN